MADQFDELTDAHVAMIARQPVFFAISSAREAERPAVAGRGGFVLGFGFGAHGREDPP